MNLLPTSYLSYVDQVYEFDMRQCYDNLVERAKFSAQGFPIGHPMIKAVNDILRADEDFLLRKEIDDKLVWNHFRLLNKISGKNFCHPHLHAEYISVEAHKWLLSQPVPRHDAVSKLHGEHLIPFNAYIAEPIRCFCEPQNISKFTFGEFKKLCSLLHIALILPEERDLLDSKETGLKERMPWDKGKTREEMAEDMKSKECNCLCNVKKISLENFTARLGMVIDLEDIAQEGISKKKGIGVGIDLIRLNDTIRALY